MNQIDNQCKAECENIQSKSYKSSVVNEFKTLSLSLLKILAQNICVHKIALSAIELSALAKIFLEDVTLLSDRHFLDTIELQQPLIRTATYPAMFSTLNNEIEFKLASQHNYIILFRYSKAILPYKIITKNISVIWCRKAHAKNTGREVNCEEVKD
ncbi:hypothetical protein Bhyg_10682 [Pseudolycoriella hygida]|uniref:Uncharacterized protein n=1 Tax=Pseudolycoriella hygida TaxID=35572 RepID=A0A9Q0RZ86_9DIPT|nr:hypothetical protein Bhyg_10682 [Pseudolycoriella hygida]